MTLVRRFLFILVAAFSLCHFSFAQSEVEKFIIEVSSSYKNPLAYYPIREDIFLPTEEEWKQIEQSKDQPLGSRNYGSFIFMSKGNLTRDRLINAQGRLIYPSKKYWGLSKRSDYHYRLRKHHLLIKGNQNLGQFLWYNQQFKELN